MAHHGNDWSTMSNPFEFNRAQNLIPALRAPGPVLWRLRAT